MHGIHGGRSAHLDKKTVERVIQKLDVLTRYNGSPHFQRGHPYLPDITRDTKEHLRQILDKNSDFGHNHYLQVTIYSLLYKTEQCIQVLSKQDAVDRRTLTKLSLIFSHILCELRALFPGGRYQGNTYRVTKLEASNFWSQTYGNRCLIKWEEFRGGLHPVHNIEAGPLESALRSTMDLTCNDYISMYEFDIFTRLFQPWETLLQNWMLLAVTHPGYMAFLTYDEVKELLQGHTHKPGSYIFRLSCTHLGQWAIGYVTANGSILQTIPHNKSLYEALNEGEKEGLYLYPNGLNSKHSLSCVAKPNPNSVIQVTQEQWELYSDMDSTFELCKICADSEKNIRIEPCGHLLCDQCLTSWQKNENTCPFCRHKITGKEKIHITSPPKQEEHQTETSGPQTFSEPPPHEVSSDHCDSRPLYGCLSLSCFCSAVSCCLTS
ncbi:PREDICTED: E3 ubiquitin-protein ligase CBL-C [Nanorana parkeri]|uniref:E3 ubiquitin-protein ligase CBL-C n=1 Tax=Nanorana parkeri TaxID=125878 RepID=UPI0008549B52|nr:PREDICTED: E3 ubiquitin-protein ligase CBL-C [Nanorana parkeri]